MHDPIDAMRVLMEQDAEVEDRRRLEEARQLDLLRPLEESAADVPTPPAEDDARFEAVANTAHQRLLAGLEGPCESEVRYAVAGGVGGGPGVIVPVPCTRLHPPAGGDPAVPGIDLDHGEVRRDIHLHGHGWTGMSYYPAWAKATPKFYFTYVPDEAGEILIQPTIHFRGLVAVAAYDRWYTSTHAYFIVRAFMDVAQYRRWDGEVWQTVVEEDRRGSHAAYFMDESRTLSKAVVVLAGDPVTIKVGLTFSGWATSKYAWCDLDFGTGTNRIKVDHVRVCKW